VYPAKQIVQSHIVGHDSVGASLLGQKEHLRIIGVHHDHDCDMLGASVLVEQVHHLRPGDRGRARPDQDRICGEEAKRLNSLSAVGGRPRFQLALTQSSTKPSSDHCVWMHYEHTAKHGFSQFLQIQQVVAALMGSSPHFHAY